VPSSAQSGPWVAVGGWLQKNPQNPCERGAWGEVINTGKRREKLLLQGSVGRSTGEKLLYVVMVTLSPAALCGEVIKSLTSPPALITSLRHAKALSRPVTPPQPLIFRTARSSSDNSDSRLRPRLLRRRYRWEITKPCSRLSNRIANVLPTRDRRRNRVNRRAV
jgi:hypothetical protein